MYIDYKQCFNTKNKIKKPLRIPIIPPLDGSMKIDELRQIAIETNAAIIGITESKLDDTVLDAEIEIEGYSVTRSDRNRHGGGVVCYIRDSIIYNLRPNFSNNFENIVLNLLLPDTKPILIGIFYNPPNKTGFIEN